MIRLTHSCIGKFEPEIDLDAYFRPFQESLIKRQVLKSSAIRQKGESQNGCYKKTNRAKFFEKRTFLTP